MKQFCVLILFTAFDSWNRLKVYILHPFGTLNSKSSIITDFNIISQFYLKVMYQKPKQNHQFYSYFLVSYTIHKSIHNTQFPYTNLKYLMFYTLQLFAGHIRRILSTIRHSKILAFNMCEIFANCRSKNDINDSSL